MTNKIGGLHDRQDGGCRRPTSAREANVGRRYFWWSFPTFTPTSSSDVGPASRHSGECRPPTLSVQFSDTQADVGHRRRRECRPAGPTSAADVALSVGKLDRQCQRPTFADTQADTQSVTLVYEKLQDSLTAMKDDLSSVQDVQR